MRHRNRFMKQKRLNMERDFILLFSALLFIVILVSFSVAHASAPVSRLGDSPEFTSLDGAATQALKRVSAVTVSSSKEYGGALLKCGAWYQFTEAVRGSGDRVGFRLVIPVGCRLAGLYHTHPSRPLSEKFSAEDVQMSQEMKVRSYIAVMKDRSVRVFDPLTMNSDLNAPASGEFLTFMESDEKPLIIRESESEVQSK